uniref:Membrane-associated protein n=1 Tax=Globodera rostochiensis TaxID=31243 RepID=A0A914HKA3_GLORO
MRFLFRCALLGTVLTAFLIVLAIQRHSVKRSSSTTVGWYAAPGYGGNAADAAASSKSAEQKQNRQELPTNEDHEIRRLLLAGAASADDTAPASRLDGASSAEMAPALMLRFPRFPPAIGGGGGTSGAEMTLNVAIVLLVSLLSIAILITAICCVIIVALALDTSSTARRWSARPSMAATSADFFLSSWPDMATQYHQLSQSPIYRTPGLDKLFQQQQQHHHYHYDYSLQQADLMAILHDAPVDTPPLTDDDYEISDDWHGHAQSRGEHRQRRNSFTIIKISPLFWSVTQCVPPAVQIHALAVEYTLNRISSSNPAAECRRPPAHWAAGS